MYYVISLRLAFTDHDPVDDIKDKALDHFSQAKTINPGTDNEEKGFIILEECHHDETPPGPCIIIEQHWTP